MISKDLEADILRLYHAERWRVGTIASQLGVHHSTVRRVLVRAGFGAPVLVKRPSMIEPFLALVHEILTRYPRLRASRLYEMVRERGLFTIERAVHKMTDVPAKMRGSSRSGAA